MKRLAGEVGAEQVEAEVGVDAAGDGAVGALVVVLEDAEVGDDGAALLREAGLVEAVDLRPSISAAMPTICAIVTTPVPPMPIMRIVFSPGAITGSGSSTGTAGTAGLMRLPGVDLEEGRAVAVQAGEVGVAGRLVDLRLAAELASRTGQHGQALGLRAAVAAALADALVDRDARLGLRELAALDRAPLLRRAHLVVDQHGDARRPCASALAATLHRSRRAPGVLVVVTTTLLDALELEPADELVDGHAALDVLPARHGDGAVVEQLVGDVDAGGDRRADGQRAGVVERAVAEVLEDVLASGERRLADPLRALAAHLREAGDLALAGAG